MPWLQHISAICRLPKSMEVPQKARNYRCFPAAQQVIRPGRLGPKRSTTWVFAGSRRRTMPLSQALATPVDEIMESSALAPRNGFHLEPRCRVCRNDWCARRSTICWPAGPATPWSCAPSRRTTPSSTSVTGSRSIRSETTAAALPRPERRQSNLPGDPGAAGKGERRRLRRGRGHRDHPHCVLRDRHGQKL